MAVVPNATTTTSSEVVINDEFISSVVRFTLGRFPVVYPLAVLRVPLAGRNSAKYDHALQQEIGLAAPLAETDEVTSTELTKEVASVTSSMFSIATFISDQNTVRSLWTEAAVATRELTQSAARRIDTDFVALANSFTGPIGSAATTNTVSNFVTVLTTYRTRTSMVADVPIMIMHGDAMRDLQLDAVSNAASWFGASMGVQFSEAVSGFRQGSVTSFGGIDMVTTDRMPVGDTTGWTNMLLSRGNIEAAIALAFEQDIQVETWREPKRKGWWFIATVDFGVGIVNDTAGLAFITKT